MGAFAKFSFSFLLFGRLAPGFGGGGGPLLEYLLNGFFFSFFGFLVFLIWPKGVFPPKNFFFAGGKKKKMGG